jgi:hypothetical protein
VPKSLNHRINNSKKGMWNCETAPIYSQSLTTANFTPPYGFLGLEISTATAESGWGLGCVDLFVRNELSNLKI